MDGISPPRSQLERIDRLRLIRSENIGPVTFRQLLSRYGSASAAIDALPEIARRGGRRKSLRIANATVAEREMSTLDALGGRHVIIGEAAYPEPLANIADAPPALLVLGHAGLLKRATVAIVGARNASTNGRRFAQSLAHELAGMDLLVASGLARGIDAAVHTGALEGGTVAVLAGGVDVIYPKENTKLYESVREQGVIISEMPPGTEPMARHFPSRNRIISGISLGVIVVEAALRSGSLITARLAGEQGRNVFAVPGSPLDPRARGTNDLLRNGATLVERAADVIDIISTMHGTWLREPAYSAFHDDPVGETDEATVTAARHNITQRLGVTPVSVDALIRDTDYPPAAIWTVLLELELAGRLERLPGAMVALIA
jgi:DNA processing protein